MPRNVSGFTDKYLHDLIIQRKITLDGNADLEDWNVSEDITNSNFKIVRETPSGENTYFSITPTGTVSISSPLITGDLDMNFNDIVNVTNLDGKLTAGNQNNITQVGTLTSLNMSGNLDLNTNNIEAVGTMTADFITASFGNDLSLGGSNLYSMRVNDSEIIADGTFNLNSNDITNGNSITATNLTGTLQTAAQTNVTSVGTLTSLNMGGDINMNSNNINNLTTLSATTLTATNLGGKLTSANQDNVTTVGTLNELYVTNDFGVNTDTLYVDSALNRVGIGIQLSNFELQIHSPLNSNSFLQFTGATSGTTSSDGFLIGLGGSDEVRIQNRENTDMRFYTNDTWNMTLTASGNLLIGTTTATPSTKLEVTSTTGAFLPPRMTTTERNALTATAGHVIFNITTDKLQVYTLGAWTNLH